MPLSKNPEFYQTIDDAIEAFGTRHHITARQHFAPLLGYKGANASIQLGSALNYSTYNPITPKPLNIDQLLILLLHLGDDRKPVLDFIAKKSNGVFHYSTPSNIKSDNMRDELLQISALSGKLNAKFLEYKNNDGVLDCDELNDLETIAYEARAQLLAFEEMLKTIKGMS